MALTLTDGSIANVALPVIAKDLNAQAGVVIWIVTGYQLAIATCLLPRARLGEIVGYRRIYKCGLSVFIAASIAWFLSRRSSRIESEGFLAALASLSRLRFSPKTQ